jgi:hypothetical protein
MEVRDNSLIQGYNSKLLQANYRIINQDISLFIPRFKSSERHYYEHHLPV